MGTTTAPTMLDCEDPVREAGSARGQGTQQARSSPRGHPQVQQQPEGQRQRSVSLRPYAQILCLDHPWSPLPSIALRVPACGLHSHSRGSAGVFRDGAESKRFRTCEPCASGGKRLCSVTGLKSGHVPGERTRRTPAPTPALFTETGRERCLAQSP